MFLFAHTRLTESRALLIAAGLVTLGLWIATLLLAPRGRLVAPLHYTIYFGIDLSGRWQNWLWFPGMATLVTVSHIIIGCRRDDVTWQRLWLSAAIALNLLLAAALAALSVLIHGGA